MRTLVILASITCLALTSACASAGTATPVILEPASTITPITPTETPQNYDPAIYVDLFSYVDEYGSLAAAFESYEAQGYCENPFREGYPRLEDGQWQLFMKNSNDGNIILHEFITDEHVVMFTLSTSSWATSLAQFNHHYRIITQVGALISFDFQGDFVDCEVNEENMLIRDFVFSPTTNDFVFRKSEPGEPIGFIAPVLTIAYGEVYASEYVTGEILCDRHNRPGEDYVAYTLPGGDGRIYSWGRKNVCMYLTADWID